MKRTDLFKHTAALLVLLCLLAAAALPAFATSASIKLTDDWGDPVTGSIRVQLYDTANQKPLRGGQLTVYRVAEVQRNNGDMHFVYCGDFDGCGIELGDLTDSTLARQLEGYLSPAAEGTVQTVDSEGCATFSQLELGLYLVVQTKASAGYQPVNSFLVSLPMAENGQWLYDVDASPKVGACTPEPETPPVPPVPPVTPDVPVEPTPQDTPDVPVTPQGPGSPAVTDSPVVTATQEITHLPKTGQLNWPVPMMAVCGMLLFACGWQLNAQGKEER